MMTLLLSILGSIVALNLLIVLILSITTRNNPYPHTPEENEEQARYIEKYAKK